MKYIKLTLQYMRNKHFWKLVLLVTVPCIAVALFTSFSTTANFIVHFFDADISTFAAVYRHTSEVDWKVLLGLLASLLVFAMLCSIFIGTMQRHMRTGTFAITNIGKRINEHFLPSLLTIASLFALIYIYGLSMTIGVSFWWAVTSNKIATFIMTIFSMIVMFFLVMYIICIFSLTCPNIVVTGQGIRDSVSYSLRASHRRLRPLFAAFSLPVVIFMAVQFANVFIEVRAVTIILDSIMNIAICSYYPVLIFVAYYDINEKDREDLLPINRM